MTNCVVLPMNSLVKCKIMEFLNFEFYSYLRAIIGSIAAAFLAGYTPKNIPTLAEKKNARNIDHMLSLAGKKVIKTGINHANDMPKITPKTPPNMLSTTDSTRN